MATPNIPILCYDQNLGYMGEFEMYESLIWTTKFTEAGEFEVVFPANADRKERILNAFYFMIPGDTHVMLPGSVRIKTDIDEGDKYLVTGFGAERILERRIIFPEVEVRGDMLYSGIEFLLRTQMGDLAEAPRRMPEVYIYTDKYRLKHTDTQKYHAAKYNLENLYDVVSSELSLAKIGMIMEPDFSRPGFNFILYSGQDRFSRTGETFVSFSPELDNLLESDYTWSRRNNFTWGLSLGNKGANEEQEPSVVVNTNESGMSRYEAYVDAKNIQRNSPDNTEIDIWTYRQMMSTQLNRIMNLNKKTEEFTSEVNIHGHFKYKEHYALGDRVLVKNGYTAEKVTRVTEVIHSCDREGFSLIPTFKAD